MRTFLLLLDAAVFILCCVGLVQIHARAGLPCDVSHREDGVYCLAVTNQSLAPGLHPGDRILEINGQRVAYSDDVEFQLDGCHIGDTVSVVVSGEEAARVLQLPTVRYYGLFYLFSAMLVSGLFFSVGLVVQWKKPEDPAAFIYHMGSLAAAMQLSITWGTYATSPAFLGPVLRSIFATVYASTPVFFFHLTHLFPHRRPTLIKGLTPMLYAAAVILAIGGAASASRAILAHSVVLFHDHLEWFRAARFFLIAVIACGLWSFGQSYLEARDEPERKKIRWVIWGVFVGFLPFVVLWVIPSMMLGYGLVPESVMLLASGFIPLAFGVSIIKYHIMDINLLLNRSLVYGTVMIVIAVAYMIVVGIVAMVVTNVTYEISLSFSIAAAILAALLFEPIRRGVQARVDWRFFRVQYDFRRAARKFQEDIKACATIEDLGRLVVSRLDALIPVERSGFVLIDAAGNSRTIAGALHGGADDALLALAAEAGGIPAGPVGVVEPGITLHEVGHEVLAPWRLTLVCPVLRADARVLGVLALGAKKSGARFTHEDVDLLRSFALEAGREIERIMLQETIMEKAHEAERLHRLNALKSDFVSYVSHELRTPLTSIRMFAELLTERVPRADKRAKEYAAIIGGEADRLQRMVNTILDSAKIDQGEQHYSLQPVRLVTLVREVVRTMRYQLAKEAFRVVVQTPKPAGKARDPLVINADPDAVREAVLNLLTNAMKYSVDAKQIRILLGRSGTGIFCAVEDRGRGIPPEAMQHLFTKFYRDPSLPRRIQGVGLGLSVVKHIMDAHGGDVSVKSVPGQGSTFTLTFPAPKHVRNAGRSDISHKRTRRQ
jgi:signal transduction histidine kinase